LRAIRKSKGSLAVEGVVLESTDILVAIGEGLDPMAVLFAVLEVADVLRTIGEGQGTRTSGIWPGGGGRSAAAAGRPPKASPKARQGRSQANFFGMGHLERGQVANSDDLGG